MRENKKSLHFRSLVKSFQSIINITNKVQSLISLTTSIVFRNLFGLKVVIIGHVNEMWEMGRIMTQEWSLLSQARVVLAFPNLATFLLASNPNYSLLKYPMCLSCQESLINAILNLGVPLDLELLFYQSISSILEITLWFTSIKAFSF